MSREKRKEACSAQQHIRPAQHSRPSLPLPSLSLSLPSRARPAQLPRPSSSHAAASRSHRWVAPPWDPPVIFLQDDATRSPATAASACSRDRHASSPSPRSASPSHPRAARTPPGPAGSRQPQAQSAHDREAISTRASYLARIPRIAGHYYILAFTSKPSPLSHWPLEPAPTCPDQIAPASIPKSPARHCYGRPIKTGTEPPLGFPNPPPPLGGAQFACQVTNSREKKEAGKLFADAGGGEEEGRRRTGAELLRSYRGEEFGAAPQDPP